MANDINIYCCYNKFAFTKGGGPQCDAAARAAASRSSLVVERSLFIYSLVLKSQFTLEFKAVSRRTFTQVSFVACSYS